jgi:UDP-N-acetylmuramoyl-L-alanyl-D-glutamate--2,6-diaminopimelate ligase
MQKAVDPSILASFNVNSLAYGIESAADLKAHNIQLGVDGISFATTYQGKSVHVDSHLIGRFNVYNLLASMGAALVYGMPLDGIAEKLRSFQAVQAA